MPQTLRNFLLLSFLSLCVLLASGQTDTGQVKLYKKNGKLKKVNSTDIFKISLRDTKGAETGIETQSHLTGSIVALDDDSLTIEISSSSIHTDQFDRQIISTYHYDNFLDTLLEVRTIPLSDIDMIAMDTKFSSAMRATGTIALITALFIAPPASFNYKNGDFNTDRYLGIIAVSVPLTVVGFVLASGFEIRQYYTTPFKRDGRRY